MRQYITPAHIAEAERRGINYDALRKRVYQYGWEIEKAIATPVRQTQPSGWRHFKEQAQARGISSALFYERVKNGWTEERAARIKPRQGYRKSDDMKDEWVEQAKAHGISRKTLRARLQRGWELEKAITTPPVHQRLRLTKEQKQTALANGIPLALVHQRVREKGWSIEKAVTTPPRHLKKKV